MIQEAGSVNMSSGEHQFSASWEFTLINKFQVRGRREVPADLCDIQIEIDQRQMHHLCRRYRSMLPTETVSRAIWNQVLRVELGAASQLTDTRGRRIQ